MVERAARMVNVRLEVSVTAAFLKIPSKTSSKKTSTPVAL
jgi:hypothetical protein